MTARKLRLLRVLLFENVADAVEELDVTLLGILLQGGDEGVGHGAGRLCVDGGVGPGSSVSAIVQSPIGKTRVLKKQRKKKGKEHSRRLVVLAAGQHDNISGRRPGLLGLLIRIIPLVRRLGELEN